MYHLDVKLGHFFPHSKGVVIVAIPTSVYGEEVGWSRSDELVGGSPTPLALALSGAGTSALGN